MKKIILAGGCFWGVEAYFKLVAGVKDTDVVYADGPLKHPSYEDVCNASGHVEAVYLTYDENTLSLNKLLDHLFNIIDPTLINRQGPDIGVQYRSGIYVFSDEDKKRVDAYIESVKDQYERPITVEVKKDVNYYVAEAYHQDYLDKHENGYCHINLSRVKNV